MTLNEPNSYFAQNYFCYPVCVNSFNVLLTKSVGVYVGRSARDYPRSSVGTLLCKK